ncbi:hypothetical protein [Raoultibacter timonensis]|uniref:Uncharacterized protein n=1 Tax=Raoultibacter timonensis TaxID=1907662 RepID=A0ABM7WKI2_9ACTN|nr:hypothetical protein [Raoultibacter timonensis]BDE96871.1 hypothetical protein CE91St30_22040 [Raoultibacter timonensis]BDF51474.1 hypothetical protein CE91St31_22040 [Raoultibacter timonensis]
MGESLKETIARSNELAYTCLEQIAQAGCDRDAVHALLKAYIGYKFLLADDEMGSEDIAALSKASVDKLLANHRKEALQDVSSVCAGASSASTKKVLLIMALQKGLGIRFDARASGAVKTIDDLAREVCARICDR